MLTPFLLGLLGLLFVPGSRDAAELLTLEDVFQLELAADPRLSPDGERVVYVRRSMDVMTDSARSSLWIVGADGSGHRPLTGGTGGDSAPRWSPDGERLAYVSRSSGRAQLHVLWLATGESAPITNVEEAPGPPSWSPDGRWLAFTMFVEEKPKPLADVPAPPEGAKWAAPARVITELHYRADGEGFLTQGHTQLFVVPADGGTPRQLTKGPYDVDGAPRWTPDGRSLVFTSNRREDHELEPVDSEIHVVDVADGSLATLTSRYGPDRSPLLSPDGSRIAYVGFDDRHQGYQVAELRVMDRDGGSPRSLTADLDRDVEEAAWAGDGRGLYVSYSDHGDTRLAFVPLDGGARVILATGVGGTTLGRPYSSGSFTVSAGGRIVYTRTSPARPADLALLEPGAREPRMLTRLNEDLLGQRALGAVEELRFASAADGLPLQGWVVKPPGFEEGRRYPMILEIHGGPFADYGDRFSAECQLYAAAGYVVLYMNPRGSTSYGQAFGNEIHHAYPGKDYDDLMSGVDEVLGRGYVDPERLYVTGGSGGGVLTAWIVGTTSRFRAAVVAKPVINWTSFTLTADAYDYFTKYWFPGPPWAEHEHYWQRSPLSRVGNVETPTMLLTGEVDYRTPISESEQFYQALKLRRIDTALVRLPEASHGIASRPSQLVSKVAHVLAWFGRYPGEERAPTDDPSDGSTDGQR